MGGDMKSLEDRMGGDMKSLEDRMGGDMKSLEAKIDGNIKSLEAKIDGNIKSMQENIKHLATKQEMKTESNKTTNYLTRWIVTGIFFNIGILYVLLKYFG